MKDMKSSSFSVRIGSALLADKCKNMSWKASREPAIKRPYAVVEQ